MTDVMVLNMSPGGQIMLIANVFVSFYYAPYLTDALHEFITVVI